MTKEYFGYRNFKFFLRHPWYDSLQHWK